MNFPDSHLPHATFTALDADDVTNVRLLAKSVDAFSLSFVRTPAEVCGRYASCCGRCRCCHADATADAMLPCWGAKWADLLMRWADTCMLMCWSTELMCWCADYWWAFELMCWLLTWWCTSWHSDVLMLVTFQIRKLQGVLKEVGREDMGIILKVSLLLRVLTLRFFFLFLFFSFLPSIFSLSVFLLSPSLLLCFIIH